jgi:murein L,D-transpeptidase YcbB/YkuD
MAAVLSVSAGSLVKSQTSQPAAAPQPAYAQPQAQAAVAAAPALREDQVEILMRTLADAESHGLKGAEFGRPEIDRLITSKDPAQRQRGIALLQKAAVAYARAQHGLRIDPDDMPSDWSIHPAAYDAQADFNFALSQNKLAEWAANQPPPFERYRALRTALAQYRNIALKGGWPQIDAGPALKPGVSDPRVIQLRQRLAAENPPGSIDVVSPVYDQTLAQIVASAQARYGLEADGIVGPAAMRAFNVPVEGRIAQIAANMERWRWMPRSWPTTRVEVNIAGARLDVYDQNRPVMDMKVAVGQPDKETPMLISAIHSVVLNPPWNVPTSIASKELVPKGGAYLARNGFQWVAGGRLQQKPGPGNSLGRIKFDFNNSFGVYLHDTNAKAVFERDARSVSHGCVRVEKPQALANLLLGTDPDWSPTTMDEILTETDTVREPLAQKIPVLLLYWTVFTGPSGEVNFRDDIYDWDKALINLLGRGAIST